MPENSTLQRYCQTKKVASRETVLVEAVCNATPKARDAMLRVRRRQRTGMKGLYNSLKKLHHIPQKMSNFKPLLRKKQLERKPIYDILVFSLQ